MKAKDLAAELLKTPEREVVIQTSAGDATASPIFGSWIGSYKNITPRAGVVGLETLTKDDKESGYSWHDVVEYGTPVVVLVPSV